MEKKKKIEIAENTSSGAEKVERIEREVKTEQTAESKKPTAQKSVAMKKEKEEKLAKARIEKAKKDKNEKLKAKAERLKKKKERMLEKKKAREKRLQERKERAEKRLALRKAQAEKRAKEREERMRERAHKKANERERRQKQAQQNRQKGKNSYGGWLAAVVTLGATTLALTTALTVGAIDMKNKEETMLGGYKSTAYELFGIMENVNDDLDRVRICASPAQQQRILTDLLVQARLAELDLEKLPVESAQDQNITSFINRVGKMSEMLLSKLRAGEQLNDMDREMLEKLYQTNLGVKEKLNEITTNLDDDMLCEFMKKNKGMFKDTLAALEELTLEENHFQQGKMKMDGAGMQRKAMPDQSSQESAGKRSPAQAEEACAKYFEKYSVSDFQCVGETLGRGYTAYNLQGADQNGNLLIAEVDASSLSLVRFNYYVPCTQVHFDMENAQKIAEEFLTASGYDTMLAAWVSENGTDADFTFAPQENGMRIDPDSVKVKVCRERGLVSAFDASKYLKYHKTRTVEKPALSVEQAQEKLHESLTAEKATLALVQTKRGEKPAYEFLCSYGDQKYFVYIDANNGNEIAILNLKNR